MSNEQFAHTIREAARAQGGSSVPDRQLCVIAKDIRRHWPKVNYAAEPYLNAMTTLENLDQMYYEDTARSVVLYFLANTGTWRGEDAKRIKTELKAMLDAHAKRK